MFSLRVAFRRSALLLAARGITALRPPSPRPPPARAKLDVRRSGSGPRTGPRAAAAGAPRAKAKATASPKGGKGRKRTTTTPTPRRKKSSAASLAPTAELAAAETNGEDDNVDDEDDEADHLVDDSFSDEFYGGKDMQLPPTWESVEGEGNEWEDGPAAEEAVEEAVEVEEDIQPSKPPKGGPRKQARKKPVPTKETLLVPEEHEEEDVQVEKPAGDGEEAGEQKVQTVEEPLSEVVKFFSDALQEKLKSTAPPTAMREARMVSTVTRKAFSPRHQKVLRAVAKREGYASHSWLTSAQARRTGNTFIMPGAKPTTIFQHVEKVVPLLALPRKDQQRILDEYPPFFGSGVGILSDRLKWKVVTSDRVNRVLNKGDEERALFLDVDQCKALQVKHDKKHEIDISAVSNISIYNADQLFDPYKGELQRGLAIDAITGKRVKQPAHDLLLTVGILRGYISPMWVTEKQLKYLNLELRKGAEPTAVEASDMSGMIVSLASLPTACRNLLLKELRAVRPDAFGQEVFFLYSVNGWEAMRSRVIVKNMIAINDPSFPFHFVNLRDLAYQKPQCAAIAMDMMSHYRPLGSILLEEEKQQQQQQQEESEELTGKKRRRKNPNRVPNTAVQRTGATRRMKPFSFFFAEDATLRRYYNAESTTTPHLAVPTVRSMALVNGHLVGRRDEAILRAFALKHKLSSPLWLTEPAAARMGVRIPSANKKRYVCIGAGAGATDAADMESVEGFYNLDDFKDPEEVLSLFPKASKRVHFMLDAKWRPVVGLQRQSFLNAQGRSTPLWVSVNECLISGFHPRPGVKPLSFPRRQKGGKAGEKGRGTKLYNSQYTSDPVRVIGLSTILVRPQGQHL